MIEKMLPYAFCFLGSLAFTLALTPVARYLCKRSGMVDKPDARRINKVPIPRGGGIAIVAGLLVSYGIFLAATGRPAMQCVSDAVFWRLAAISVGIAMLGLVDDKFSLPPMVKLLGQIAAAALVWSWAGIGFSRLYPQLPGWADCLMTIFWIVGAINAFNLIDGLDGLATGIALIATVGMAGGICFAMNPQQTFFYFAFAGALAGFLYYNYNPASIFLGDCGSMFIGFVLSTLPLTSQEPNSFLVSVGMPVLAMGIPIFDTALAILRRLIRKILMGKSPSGGVMTADKDHIHHRIFRAVGLNQRRAAWTLYGITAFLVAVGLGGMYLDSRAGGLWLLTLAIGCVVALRDLSRIELFEAGRLLDVAAHAERPVSQRRIDRLSTVIYLVFDAAATVVAFFFTLRLLGLGFDGLAMRMMLPVSVFCVFATLVFFRTYITVWARAMASNYARLFAACVLGAVFAAVAIYYLSGLKDFRAHSFSALFASLTFIAVLGVRFLRPVVRDLIFEISCMRLSSRNEKDVSRILVYGCGLRYRSFRRELVRGLSVNNRLIVGLLDDNVIFHGKYIGGVKVFGSIKDVRSVAEKLSADSVVVACELDEEKLAAVKKLLEECALKATYFGFSEKKI